jgi:hypothetical protein
MSPRRVFSRSGGGFIAIGALTRAVKLLQGGEGSRKVHVASGLRRDAARRVIKSVKNAAFAPAARQ